MHFLRMSVSPATEKLIGQCAQSKVARAQWRYGSYVLASTRQRSVLFHKVPLSLKIHPIQNQAPLNFLLIVLSWSGIVLMS